MRAADCNPFVKKEYFLTAPPDAPGSADRYVSSGNEEELHKEEQRDGICQQRNILALARAELEHGIADQTQPMPWPIEPETGMEMSMMATGRL